MSRFTTEQILHLIEEKGGARNVSLAGEDLSEIDLSAATIRALFNAKGYSEESPPAWWSGRKKSEGKAQRAILAGTARDSQASEVIAKNSINLEGIGLEGANLVGAQLQEADLEGANLRGAFMHGANIFRARLWDADLQGARLQRANLERAALQNASFYWANLRGANLAGVLLYNVKLDKTDMESSQFAKGLYEEQQKHWQDAKEAYLRLKNNFVSIGRYTDAGWAYVREKRMERKAATIPHKLYSYLWDFLCQYGESPSRVVVWLGALGFLVFPLLYMASDALELEESLLSQYVNYLALSLRSLVTNTFGTAVPSTFVGSVLASLEGALGISLFALLMYCAGRRMSGY